MVKQDVRHQKVRISHGGSGGGRGGGEPTFSSSRFRVPSFTRMPELACARDVHNLSPRASIIPHACLFQQ